MSAALSFEQYAAALHDHRRASCEAFQALMQFHSRFARLRSGATPGFGLTHARLRVLRAIATLPGACIAELARELDLTRQAVHRVVHDLRRMGLQGLHAAHGFRGMFRTVARERLRIDADVLEAQLAHAKRDHIQKAYDRTSFVRERTLAMQRWADYLDRLRKEEPKVVPFKRTA